MTNKDYAFIKDNIVIDCLIFDNPSNELLNLFKNEKNADLIVLANNRTVIGGEYDGLNFWPIQPYYSWIKNEELNDWEAPIPYPVFDPENPRYYQWNEDILNWEEVQLSE
jgi:hypothetical protein